MLRLVTLTKQALNDRVICVVVREIYHITESQHWKSLRWNPVIQSCRLYYQVTLFWPKQGLHFYTSFSFSKESGRSLLSWETKRLTLGRLRPDLYTGSRSLQRISLVSRWTVVLVSWIYYNYTAGLKATACSHPSKYKRKKCDGFPFHVLLVLLRWE